MIKDIFHSIITAAQRLIANWGALMISLLLYAALLGALYIFFTIREATAVQVALSLILPIAAIAIFFMLQAMGLSYMRIGVGAGYLLKRALKDCWMILLVSLPVILLAVLIAYLFGKVDQTWFNPSAIAASKARAWGSVVVSALRIFLLFFLFPSLAIHLWIATVREGAAVALKGFGRALVRALAPRSLLIYSLICACFGAIAYFMLFKKVMFKSEWTELWAVGIKTAVALLLVFIGWLLTLGSIAEMTARRAMREL